MADTERIKSQEHRRALKTLSVLLIEDNEGDAKLVREYLHDAQQAPEATFRYAIDWQATLADGIDHLRQRPGGFDIVLLDMNLPDSQGAQTLGRIKAAAPSLPVIILSGIGDQDFATRSVGSGAQDYLYKSNMNDEILARAIRYAMERQRAERNLVEARTDLQNLIDSLDDVVFSIDLLGQRVLQVSQSCQGLYGMSAEAFRANPRAWLDAVHPEDAAQVAAAYQRLLKGDAQDVRHRIVRPDGDVRWVRARLKPGLRADGRLARLDAIVGDVSDAQRAQEAARIAREQKLEIKRLRDTNEYKSQLLSTASHEMNTPLTPLKVQLHLLKSGGYGPLEESQLEAVDILERNFDRLSLLVRDVLDVSRLQNNRLTVNLERFDLGSVVAETESSFRDMAASSGLALAIESEKDLWVRADPKRLTQVVYNLVLNAIKYTPTGGRISLKAWREDGLVKLTVTDTGIGLTKEKAATLFQPFIRQDEPVRKGFAGTGLGLYISRGIMEQHGGEIWCKSAGPDKGTTFGISLAAETPLPARPRA
jgi:PAS domain S-box-containing protein